MSKILCADFWLAIDFLNIFFINSESCKILKSL